MKNALKVGTPANEKRFEGGAGTNQNVFEGGRQPNSKWSSNKIVTNIMAFGPFLLLWRDFEPMNRIRNLHQSPTSQPIHHRILIDGGSFGRRRRLVSFT